MLLNAVSSFASGSGDELTMTIRDEKGPTQGCGYKLRESRRRPKLKASESEMAVEAECLLNTLAPHQRK